MEQLKVLRKYRQMKNISIQDLSKATNISRERISLIERGKVNPLFHNVLTIADALGVELIFHIR